MSIRVGAMFEALFASEAMRRGLDVSTPTGHHLPFDLIVSNSAGKLYRVQVKGTCSEQGGFYKFATRRGKGTVKRVDYKTEIDVLAGIVERPGDRFFYIIPSHSLGNQLSIKVRPHFDSRAQFEKYKEAWEVFDS
jgi:hypothetical protein